MRTVLKIVVGLVAAYAAGFLLFVLTLPAAKTPPQRADGIVALTGGNARLDAAVALLEHGAARRLLITGVHRTTTKAELRLLSHGGRKFDCCTDIGRDAANTRGNAEEAALWARDHRYRSLIVVTARYHMPRSLTEFQAAMPGERLVPYPVEPANVNLSGWWHDAGALHLLHNEYAKYLASCVITRLESRPAALDRSAAQRKLAHPVLSRHHMLFLRSTLFFVWFALVSIVLALLYLPVLLLPRKAMVACSRFWSRAVLFGLKWIAGLGFEVRGAPPGAAS